MKTLTTALALLAIFYTSNSMDCNCDCDDDGNDDNGIERPCPTFDMDCVDHAFADHLSCKVRTDRSDCQLIRYLPLYYTKSNVSLVYKYAVGRGFRNYSIDEFYINHISNTLVLKITFKKLTVTSPDTMGIFMRDGKEPIVTRGKVLTVYENYPLTLTVFNADDRTDRRLPRFQVFTYVTDQSPKIGYNSSIVPTDPEASQQFQSILDNLGLSLQEETITQGQLFMSYVLPCDLKISVLQD